MSDEIRVGDRVSLAGETWTYELVALKGRWAWVFRADGLPLTVRPSDLTRIEPEPVTPLYKVGEKVRLRQDHSHVFTVVDIEILYRDPTNNSQGQGWYEDTLELAPEPCDKCGK